MPDMDLIRRVQQARMAHDAAAQPSAITGAYWIEAKPAQADEQRFQPTPRAGHWVVLVAVHAVDERWAVVKAATEAGQLGYKSKIATGAAPGQPRPDVRVIHVCTYDADDTADVDRVRAALEALGLGEGLHYER